MKDPKSQISNGKGQTVWSRKRLIFVICHFSLLLLAFGLRLAPLNRYVTPDEPGWVYRAIRFTEAFVARDWAGTAVAGHPGVTTTWLGALSVKATQLLAPTESAAHLEWIRRLAWLDPENGEAFGHLSYFLPCGRVAVALTTTLGLATLGPLLARPFGRRTALLVTGLLAFDPFLVGHSGLLHTDGLVTTFVMLALAAALDGLYEPDRVGWWGLSGVFAGLAILTKTPAIVLLPFVGLIQLIAHLRRHLIPRAPLRDTAKPRSLTQRALSVAFHFLLFLLMATLTIGVLYPALWGDPDATVRSLFSLAERHVESTQRDVFFAGRFQRDPGPIFYPTILLFRLSPIALGGLAIGLAAIRRLSPSRRLTFLLMLTFALGFGALMSVGVKKHDRYLLPVFPPLTVAAAVGWAYLGKHLSERGISLRGRDLPPSFSHPVLLILQALMALAFLSCPLAYANPLAGGPWVASRVIEMDWGEGMGTAARWLNRRTGAKDLVVATDSVPTFASVFAGRTVPVDQVSRADYIALPAHHPADRLSAQPAHRLTLGFVDRAVVYTNTAPVRQAAFLAENAADGDLIVVDADTPLLDHYAGPAIIIPVAHLPTQTAMADQLAEVTSGHTLWLVADPAASPITARHLRQTVESIATPVRTTTIAAAEITSYTRVESEIPAIKSQTATFGHQIDLVDSALPTGPVGEPFDVVLRWQAAVQPPGDLQAALHLYDPAGHVWDSVGQPILNTTTFPASAWAPGEWADNAFRVKVPPHIPPSVYELHLTVNDNAGALLGAWDGDGAFLGVRVVLGEIAIAPPAKPAGQAACDGEKVSADPFVACIPESPPETVPSGDAFTVAIIWSATAAPEGDYAVRWRLADGAGSVVLEETTPLSPYATSSWRAGDSFESRYDLRLAPTTPAGSYGLVLNVLTPDGRAVWSNDHIVNAIEVAHRERRFDLPDDIAHPLDLTLGGGVHLRGFGLIAARASPGDALPLTLYWQGDGPTDIDYTVFVHLVGPDGQNHGQLDYTPGHGASPTSSWAPEQVIVDDLVLPVAADAVAGTYHIAVGLYDAVSGGRLPIVDGSGSLIPDGQAILPVEIIIPE
jgi:hypothetical protein